MKNDDQIYKECVDALIENVGLVEATRFITLIKRQPPFDYTKWRETQYKDETIETIFQKAAELRAQTEREGKMNEALSRTPRPPKAAKKPAVRRKAPKQAVHA